MTTKPARGKWTTTSPTRGSLRLSEMRAAVSPTSTPSTGTLPVSSGVTLILRPAGNPLVSARLPEAFPLGECRALDQRQLEAIGHGLVS